VAVPAVAHFSLPERAYELWLKGELLEKLGIRDDGKTRVEIIGGEIVVSPGPLIDHAGIATDIHDAFTLARAADGEYPWRVIQNGDFNLRHIADGYIPDLIVLDVGDFNAARAAQARHVTAEQVGMVVEITSKSTAADDRAPGPHRVRPTKWKGYAREGVEFYLLVDRAPRAAKATLFTEPDLAEGVYGVEQSWPFGESLLLPEPFKVEIPTSLWEPWDE
jgi:hypothetical protein